MADTHSQMVRWWLNLRSIFSSQSLKFVSTDLITQFNIWQREVQLQFHVAKVSLCSLVFYIILNLISAYIRG